MTTPITIIKNAPAPPDVCRNHNSVYPFRAMEIGDAFDFALETKGRVTPAAHYFGKRNGRKYTIRTIDENTGRCWRVA